MKIEKKVNLPVGETVSNLYSQAEIEKTLI